MALLKHRFAGIELRLGQRGFTVVIQTQRAQQFDIADKRRIGESLHHGLFVERHTVDIIVFDDYFSQLPSVSRLLERLLIQPGQLRPRL